MAITRKDQQELDQIFADLSPTLNGQKEDYFALLHIAKKFKCEPRDIAQQVAFGGNDYGLDAYYIDRPSKNLYLFQFKWSENHNLFKDSLERLASAGIERIFGNPLQDPNQNEYLRLLKADLCECQDLIERVYVQFVFKGDLDSAENSFGLRDRRENLDNKKWIIEQFFKGRPVSLVVEFLADKRQPPSTPPPDTHEVQFTDSVTVETPDKEKVLHVGFVRLMDLHRIYKSLGQKFFNRNIRAGLSADNPPNRKIREALSAIVIKQQYPAEVFAFNHNGITLAAEDVQIRDGIAIIKVPRLLNGAQSVSSVDKFLEENDGHPALKQNKEVLESLRVLAKIVEYDPLSEFVQTVTICNNQQNPVNPWNLRANDRIQCDLQDKFKEELGIFYSRQENAFENLTDADLEEMGIADSRDLKIKHLAQTFLAAQGELDKMSRLRDVFEIQKVYDETFRESYLHSDARKIVLAYKVGLVLNSPMRRLEALAPKKLGYAIGRARNLVWALLIQSLLNDDKTGYWLDTYGQTLAKEADFRSLLEQKAGSRVLPIVKAVLSDSNYITKIENEKYSFLRAKELFRRCMDDAYTRFNWTRRQI
jgi:hypothetical protein